MNNMNNKKHIFDNPKNVKLLIRSLYIGCFTLFAMDLFIHRHTYHPWESFTGFYAFYGFLSCVVLVLLARELRKLVMRDEDYYDIKEMSVIELETEDTKENYSNGRNQGYKKEKEKRHLDDRSKR